MFCGVEDGRGFVSGKMTVLLASGVYGAERDLSLSLSLFSGITFLISAVAPITSIKSRGLPSGMASITDFFFIFNVFALDGLFSLGVIPLAFAGLFSAGVKVLLTSSCYRRICFFLLAFFFLSTTALMSLGLVSGSGLVIFSALLALITDEPFGD